MGLVPQLGLAKKAPSPLRNHDHYSSFGYIMQEKPRTLLYLPNLPGEDFGRNLAAAKGTGALVPAL